MDKIIEIISEENKAKYNKFNEENVIIWCNKKT